MIVCAFIPNFAVTVARAGNTALCNKPLILTYETPKKTLIYATSTTARHAEVTPGMSLARAKALCPEAEVAPMVRIRLHQAADALLEQLARFSNHLEIEFRDSATLWIDMGAIERDEALSISRDLRNQMAAYTVSIGIAANKFTAQIAAITAPKFMADDNGIVFVPPGREAVFLAPFPLARLALGGPLIHQFRLLGIETLGQCTALPRTAVYERFGAVGKQLYARAQGIDLRPVTAYTPRSTEIWMQDFEPSVSDRQILEHTLRSGVGDLAEKLKSKNLAASEITLLIHLDHDHILEMRHQTREAAMSAFALSTELYRLLKSAAIVTPVAGLEVVLAGLHEPVPYQLDFFGKLFADESSMATIADRLHPRHHSAGFYTVHSASHTSYIPEHDFLLERMAGT